MEMDKLSAIEQRSGYWEYPEKEGKILETSGCTENSEINLFFKKHRRLLVDNEIFK